MSEALRLADDLENYGEFQSYFDEIAAELRRLHAENEALQSENRTLVRQNGQWQALNAELVEALREIEQHNLHSPVRVVSVIARAALAKVETSK